jgi:primosomal protein N' (replication factor Y)
VTGEGGEVPAADVYVGTEAVLHRVRNVDVVAFLDFDALLLAPRYRAAEQAMALLVRAARLVGGRDRGGRVIVQTYVPNHEVVQAAMLGDAGRLADGELARRRLLGLPPFRALAVIEGAQAESVAQAAGLEYANSHKGVIVRADDWLTLGRALAAAASSGARPKGSRLRIEVDPPRV